jgi:hypothetical protein
VKHSYSYLPADNYSKAIARLEKSISTGRFASYTQQKKQQLWNRVCRYARQLGITIKSSIVAACMAAGLIIANPSSAQTYTLQAPGSNPFNGVDVGIRSSPAFVDIDNDGDRDAFIGTSTGSIVYYKNTGTATAPVFTLQAGVANPFNGVTVAQNATPDFVDIDNDGDKDVFIGDFNGRISYYKNTGSITVPAFTIQTGGSNPLNSVGLPGPAYVSEPAFVDIDNDGDQDVFITTFYNNCLYYKNTGNVTTPVFTLQAGAANPFNGMTFGGAGSSPAFLDVDVDGDKDAFFGVGNGAIFYFKNTGSVTAPVFAQQTSTNNPFNGVDIGSYASIGIVNIDGDADLDVLIGESGGTIIFYRNTAVSLPLHLLSFNGSRQDDHNKLEWETADEINTKWFEIERSTNGRDFSTIDIVNATGNGSNGGNSYSLNDQSAGFGKSYYRLKMVDIDQQFTYSRIIWINSDQSAGISIYPNPVADIININTGNARIIKTVAYIYSGDGRLMQTISISRNTEQINVKSLLPGLYTIKFADGMVQKFLKK